MADRAKGKRPFIEDDDPERPPMEKKPRFPKGKKAKKGGGEGVGLYRAAVGDDEESLEGVMDPKLAAKERAKRRSQIREEELFREKQADILAAEVYYDENTNFEDDGVQIEPFNLKQEREEGYFDANGNYVEYAIQNEIKDAWLDNVIVDSTYAGKGKKKATSDEEYQELSSEDLGKIKRSIANVLQRGETITQALKRLKGTSSDKKGKMPEGVKHVFDQLTEDAMTLLGNGEYNVYNEEREVFEREAEGYERIACARKGVFATAEYGSSINNQGEDVLSSGVEHGAGSSSIWDGPISNSDAKTSVQVSSGDGEDEFDMFGDDDDSTNVNLQSNGSGLSSNSVLEQFPQPASESLNHQLELNSGEAASGTESDYVYDSSSGYYYSSSLGYYYDPASTLYCSATSAKWYSYNEQTNEYVEVPNADLAAAES